MDLGADKLTTNPSVVSQETKEGAVLLEMTTGDCFELNHLGAVDLGSAGEGRTTGRTSSRRWRIDTVFHRPPSKPTHLD